MLIEIPAIFTPQEAATLRTRLGQASWHDGGRTAGSVAARAKANLQLADDDPLGREIGGVIAERLAANPRFLATALPLRILPPRFNRYTGGGTYGQHVDSAIFAVPGSPDRVRSDLSATLFLSEPDEYDGGELVIGSGWKDAVVKLRAGHLLLYPADTLHRVTPVTSGERFASFFWIQSLVRSTVRRKLLQSLDDSIQALAASDASHPEIVRLTGVYHNLLREWAET